MIDHKFLFEYYFEGEAYSIDVIAADREEAERRVKRMSSAHYCGEIHAIIRVPGGNWIAKMLGIK